MLKNIITNMLKINIKNFNFYTIIAILFLLSGLLFWFYWIARYGVIYDIGIYSIVSVFVLGGLAGILLSLLDE